MKVRFSPTARRQIVAFVEWWDQRATRASVWRTRSRRRSWVTLAVNHGGDSDSTGSVAGNLLGLVQGEAGIPERWLEGLELRREITRVADDLWEHFGGGRVGPCEDWERYPGG